MKSNSATYPTRLASITAIVTTLFAHINSSLAACSTTRPTSAIDNFIRISQDSNLLSAILTATAFSIVVGFTSLGLNMAFERLREFEGGLMPARFVGAIGRQRSRSKSNQAKPKSLGSWLVGYLPEETQRYFQDQCKAALQQKRSKICTRIEIAQLFLSSFRGAVVDWIQNFGSSNRTTK